MVATKLSNTYFSGDKQNFAIPVLWVPIRGRCWGKRTTTESRQEVVRKPRAESEAVCSQVPGWRWWHTRTMFEIINKSDMIRKSSPELSIQSRIQHKLLHSLREA
jgi:hypothetical protein